MQTLSAGCLAAALAVVGCGESPPKLAPVAGRITLDGQPVPSATVSFLPLTPGLSTSHGLTDSEGFYSLMFTRTREGAIPGDYRVEVTWSAEVASLIGKTVPTGETEVAVPGAGQLTTTVIDGENEIDFDLVTE